MNQLTAGISDAPAPVVNPAATVLVRVRRTFLALVALAFVYSWITTASRGGCPSGLAADGGFVDAASVDAQSSQLCYMLSLSPMPLMYVALAGAFVFALSRAIRNAGDASAAILVLDRTVAVAAVVVVVSAVLSQLWFWRIPVEEWITNRGPLLYSVFPMGQITLDVTPR
ncbi:hypothetical protein [Salinibacterium sp. ZJ77]|uniref:hypothetical protein n=1 Tax=Salinibacterium sp. ZJ77 TaxID=2708337 RepID=UPI001420886F|nr:hypothetical protein [Salinibacterium sp. ZJ77]